MTSQPDRGTRSVTVLARIADDRVEALRKTLREAGTPFAHVPGVHVVRLVVVEDVVAQVRPAVWRWKARLLDLVVHAGRGPRPDRLPHPYLLLTATVDGPQERFFAGMRALGPQADAIWEHCTGYPGSERAAGFVRFFVERSQRADYTFAGAPGGTVGELREAAGMRRRLAALAAEGNAGRVPALTTSGPAPVPQRPRAVVSEALRLGDIQGMVLRGFGHHHAAAHLFLRFAGPDAARSWLGELAPRVTSAAEVQERPNRALHLGLSHAGLAALGVTGAELDAFPDEFRAGMYAREAALSPGRGTGPWAAPFDRPGAVHAVLMVSATTREILDASLRELRAGTGPDAGVTVAGEIRGDRLLADRGGRRTFVEHFGFADGLSTPKIDGYDEGAGDELLPPGEFVLGLPDVDGDAAGRGIPADLARNGSFLVYRKLEQDVAAFRETTAAVADRFEGGAGDVAAALVGRAIDGSSLERCPVASHVRRANPLGTLPGGIRLSRRHMMLRRGIPYGPELPDGVPDDARERGLLFLAVVGDIHRQFEFVQTQWMADGNVFGRGGEQDVFTTAGGPGARVLVEGEPPAYVPIPRPLVTCRGGEYFLLPGLTALAALAGRTGR
ncbi:Dyp-type peroxidase [Nucisporomicrobium flavum]|uniref:Dyp-type peroxidase n=1 Tax=Nucisporomicrobium flavum TaxID=2785915 RepID=UPI0018F2A7E7|nr:Dyp-type peroxidase domain-containing protein [Nucisporomicrobium flavum]